MRLRYLTLLLAVASLVVASPASADTGFAANLNSAQEVPVNASPGTGTATLILNNAQTSLSYTVTYQNLVANRTAAHIHGPAAPGVNAGVVHGLLGQFGTTSGGAAGAWAIDAVNVGRLFAGTLYVNIHSGTFPGGEIRGQIDGAPTSTQSTTWGRLKKLYK
jgi:hypothetical protein